MRNPATIQSRLSRYRTSCVDKRSAAVCLEGDISKASQALTKHAGVPNPSTSSVTARWF